MKKEVYSKHEERKAAIKNLLIAALVILFFISIVLGYYTMIYNTQRKNIIKTGELSATDSANKFNDYIATNIDAVRLTAYTLEGMLKDGRSQEDILKYLEGQSDAVQGAILADSTGLYGYINGEFMSGTGWTPPTGYDPTTRPWYTQAMANKDTLTMIDPYHDQQTGNMMMAIAIRLNDGVNVVSLDLSLREIQKITENAVANGKSDMEMILDDDNLVIAHSNEEEIGKNYSKEKDNFAEKLINELSLGDSGYAEFTYDHTRYIAYSARIGKDWQCISVRNATQVYQPLKAIFIATIIVVLIVVLVLSRIFKFTNQRVIIAERLNKQLSATADIYVSVHDINVMNNTFAEIITNKADIAKKVENSTSDAQGALIAAMKDFTSPKSIESILNFIDLSTLDIRMKKKKTITLEFLNADELWRRARFIISQYTPEGKIAHVLWLVEDIDEEKRNRDKMIDAITTLNEQVSSISNIYMTVYDINIKEDDFTEIKAQSKMVTDIIRDKKGETQVVLSKVMDGVTDLSSREEVLRFTNLSTLPARMRDVDTLTIEYLNKYKQWRRGRFIASKRDANGSLVHVLWVVEDIDQEKRDRDKLIDMSERAIAASEAKSSFLSNMSHEIRTPINTLLGMNEMILRECNDTGIVSYANNIKNAGTTLLGLINDILDFSKIEAGKMEIIPNNYDLSVVLNDLATILKQRADEKGLFISLDFDKNTPKFLVGDDMRIKQIISNILTNAVKYTEKGSIIFTVGYETITSEPNSILMNVSIKDTGIGIRPEDMEKLFSEFERIDEDRNRAIEGTGLGMTITQQLLKMMGTTLNVESVYGLGSRFFFSIKQKVTKWEPIGDYEASYNEAISDQDEYHEMFVAPTASALIVDDNHMNLTVFKNLLKRTQMRIDTATNGDNGLELSKKKKYDILFIDHMMPVKDGIELLHDIKMSKSNPNAETPAICLTANAITGAREHYISEGFDNYLSKPIDPRKLEEMILSFIPKDKVVKGTVASKPAIDEKSSIIPDFVSTINEIDMQSGLHNSLNTATYLETLKVYAETAEGSAKEIEVFMATNDLKNATIKIHALKSSSRIIGANDIGALAEHLEACGNNEDFKAVRDGIDELLGRVRVLAKKLSPLLDMDTIASSDLPMIHEEVLKDALSEIKEFATYCDNAGIEEILEKLREYEIPAASKDLVKSIERASYNFDFERITELLDKDY